MTKPKKKANRKTIPVFLTKRHGAEDAPDNPPDSPVIVEPEDVLTGTITCRQSLRLNLTHSETLGNGNMSNRVSPRFNIIKPILDRNRNNGSQCRSSILTLIYHTFQSNVPD